MQDTGDDLALYAPSRLVSPIDEGAVAALMQAYRNALYSPQRQRQSLRNMRRMLLLFSANLLLAPTARRERGGRAQLHTSYALGQL